MKNTFTNNSLASLGSEEIWPSKEMPRRILPHNPGSFTREVRELV